MPYTYRRENVLIFVLNMSLNKTFYPWCSVKDPLLSLPIIALQIVYLHIYVGISFNFKNAKIKIPFEKIVNSVLHNIDTSSLFIKNSKV